MPLFRKDTAETAPDGDPAAHPSRDALVPTHTLTVELLDWLIAALEAVLNTPQLQQAAERRISQSLHDALKMADHLYPATQEVRRKLNLWELANRPTGVKFAEEVDRAAEERLLEEGHLGEHQDGTRGWATPEAGGSHRDVEGGQVTPSQEG